MDDKTYGKGFLPYGAAALLVGLVGGFAAVLGPAFVKDLGLDYNNTTWTALATAIASAACAPVLGKLADALGRGRTLLLGVGIFTLGNGLTAAADSLTVMLMARAVVGIGMAAIAPVVMAYIVTEFPQDKIAAGFSIYMLISSGSVVLGPTAGAWIIQTWGWRTMMWLCTALCIVVLLYCLLFREKSAGKKEALDGFDGLGAVLVPVFFGLVLCVPSVGQNIGWDTWTFRLIFLAAAAALAALIAAEQRAKKPILPKAFLRRKTFLLPVAVLFLTQGLMQANMTNTIVFVEYTQPENTVVSGYAISVMYVGMALGAILLGPLADKKEPKQVLTGSLGVTAAGCAGLLLFTRQTPALLLMLSLGTLGFGLGANGTILMKVALSGLSAQMAGTGTGIYGLFRDLAAPFGVAVLVPMFTNGVTAGIGKGLEHHQAAVSAVRVLAVVELLCVAAGILLVRMFPSVRGSGDEM